MRNRGFSLVEVLATTAALSIAGAAFMGLSQIANQDSKQLRATRIVVTARAQVEAALKNPPAWRQTVARNSSFACVLSAPGCALNSAPNSQGYYDFVLYGTQDAAKVSYDPTDGTTRFALQGGACAAGVENPSAQCPLKYVARWKPLCQTYPCVNPTLDIKVSLEIEPVASLSLNPLKYEYGSVRQIDDASLRSACQVLNGTYNSITGICVPNYAGRSCASLGKPAQVVTSVSADGTITCSPLYSGQCNGTTQVMSGIGVTGVAQCAPRVQPANCPTPCVGQWQGCSAACNGGTQTYAVITPETNGGAACTAPMPGSTQACNTQPCPVACVGAWSACTASCGTGTQTYSITTPAANGGAACSTFNGHQVDCNTQACVVDANCAGSWSACNVVSGTRTFTVTQAQQGAGTACPSPLTQNCAVDCVGSWSTCSAGAPAFKTYTWTTPPLNGGSVATCEYPNGQTDSTGCDAAGACGPANGAALAYAPTSARCNQGTPTAPVWQARAPGGVTQAGIWKWDCIGANSTVTCQATSANRWSYCLAAGTQITLASGKTKSIEDIEVGESILTYDEITNTKVESPVEKVFHHEAKESTLYTFHFGSETLTSNDLHRLFLPRDGGYKSAEEAYQMWRAKKPVYLLSQAQEEVMVSKVDVRVETVPLFNLHVTGRYDRFPYSSEPWSARANHNYFANGVLVHNVKMCGGKSVHTEIKDAAEPCEQPPAICNFGLNVMMCDFENPAGLAGFLACYEPKGATCGGSPF